MENNIIFFTISSFFICLLNTTDSVEDFLANQFFLFFVDLIDFHLKASKHWHMLVTEIFYHPILTANYFLFC